MQRRFFLAALPLAACTPRGFRTTRLIVVRHGDRDGNNAPNLNETGIARMGNLDAALADLPIDAIFIPDVPRNRQSAAALAQARGITPEVVQTQQSLAAFLLGNNEGRSVIWIGNSSNIAQIWDDLGLASRPPLGYGEISVIEQRYFGRFDITERRVDA